MALPKVAEGGQARDTSLRVQRHTMTMPTYTPPQSPGPQTPIAYAPIGPVRDAEHLKLLKIFHYLYGAFMLVGSLGLSGFYVSIGMMMLRNPSIIRFAPPPPTTSPSGVGSSQFASAGLAWFFLAFAVTILIGGGTLGILAILSGRAMGQHRRRTLSLAVAGINCVIVPLGTVLGIFTFLVLLRESVVAMYGERGSSPADGQAGVGGEQRAV